MNALIDIARLNEVLRVDQATGNLFWRVARGSVKAGAQAGSPMAKGHLLVGVDGCHLLAHRIVFALTHKRWPEGQVDHKNGQPDDNRPSNIREATHSQNLWNRGVQKNNKSGLKGVCLARPHCDDGIWKAQINVGGRLYYLGSFQDKEDAAAAYREAALRLHGDFAKVA